MFIIVFLLMITMLKYNSNEIIDITNINYKSKNNKREQPKGSNYLQIHKSKVTVNNTNKCYVPRIEGIEVDKLTRDSMTIHNGTMDDEYITIPSYSFPVREHRRIYRYGLPNRYGFDQII